MKTHTDIKTFEDACEYLKLDSKSIIPDSSCFPEKHRKSLDANAKLIILAEAVNTIDNDGKEWFPDWSNSGEYKYIPWFEKSSSASRFSYYDCGSWSAGTGVGSRLCFRTSEIAEYFGKQFVDLYNDSFDKCEVVEETPSLDGKIASIEGIDYKLTIQK